MSHNVIKVRALLSAPHLTPEHRLRNLFKEFSRRRTLEVHAPNKPYWDEFYWGLSSLSCFSHLDKRKRKKCLEALSTLQADEIYYFCKVGMTFAAKMLLASDNADFRKMYSYIAADFATHTHWCQNFSANGLRRSQPDPFNHFCARLIETASPKVLSFLYQVCIVGSIIPRLREAAASALEPQLTAVYQHMICDYRIHVASGIIISENMRFSEFEKAFIRKTVDELHEYLQCQPCKHIMLTSQSLPTSDLALLLESKRYIEMVQECLSELHLVLGQCKPAAYLKKQAGSDVKLPPSVDALLFIYNKHYAKLCSTS